MAERGWSKREASYFNTTRDMQALERPFDVISTNINTVPEFSACMPSLVTTLAGTQYACIYPLNAATYSVIL